MADMNVAVRIVAEDKASGPIKGVSNALGGLSSAAKAPGNAIGGLMDGLGKFGLAGMGISTVTGAVGGLANAVGFDLANQMEQATAQFNAFTKDSAKSAEIIEQVRVEAAKTPFTFQEMTMAAAGLLPVTKASGESLQDLLKDAEVLSASNPMQGFEGAVFSLREAVTGDFTSIIERFNLSRSTINKLKEEGVPNIEIVRKAMLEMGFDSDLVSAKAETLEGRWSTFQDTIDNLKMRLAQPIFEAAKEGLMGLGGVLEDSMPLLEGMADTLAGGFKQAVGTFRSVMSAGQAIVTAFTRDTGAMGIVLDKVREIFGDTVADALQPFIQWFMEAIPEIKSFVAILQGRFEILAEIVGKVFGGDIAGALDLFQGDLKDNTDQLLLTLGEWGKAFLDWLGPMIPPLMAQLGELLGGMLKWIGEDAGPKLLQQLGVWGKAFIDWVAEYVLPKIGPTLGYILFGGEGWMGLIPWLGERLENDIIPKLREWGAAFISWVAKEVLPNIGPAVGYILFGGPGWKGIVPWIVEDAGPAIVTALAEWGKAFIGWVAKDVIPELPKALNAVQDAIAAWIADPALPWIGQQLVRLGTAMVDAIVSGFSALGAGLKAAWEAVDFSAGPIRFTGKNGFEWTGGPLVIPAPRIELPNVGAAVSNLAGAASNTVSNAVKQASGATPEFQRGPGTMAQSVGNQILKAAGLTADQIMAYCGPLAAEAIYRGVKGINIDIPSLTAKAMQAGWTSMGMRGPASEQTLLKLLGIDSIQGTVEQAMAALQQGVQVAISTPKHYFLATGISEAGKLIVGESGKVMGAATELALSEISRLGGGIQAYIIPSFQKGGEAITALGGVFETAAQSIARNTGAFESIETAASDSFDAIVEGTGDMVDQQPEINEWWKTFETAEESVARNMGKVADAAGVTEESIEDLTRESGLDFETVQKNAEAAGMDVRKWLQEVGVPAAKDLTKHLDITGNAAKDLVDPVGDAKDATRDLASEGLLKGKDAATQISHVLQQLAEKMPDLIRDTNSFTEALKAIPRDIEINIRTNGSMAVAAGAGGGGGGGGGGDGGGGGGGIDYDRVNSDPEYRQELRDQGYSVSRPNDDPNEPIVVERRQHGGIAFGGRPYLVGEAGPEMFVPHTNGTVMPSGSWGSGIDYEKLGAVLASQLRSNPPRVAIEDVRSALLRIGQRNGGVVGLA